MVKIIIGVLGIFLLVAFCGIQGVTCVGYKQAVSGHLKRAADANTRELAVAELEAAIQGAERRGLCNKAGAEVYAANCYTSVLWRTPDEDVGFWRTNLDASLTDLQSLPADGDRLLISNTLMKLRETLLDDGKNGTRVTAPGGINVYPHNAAVGWLGIIGLLLLIGGVVWFVAEG